MIPSAKEMMPNRPADQFFKAAWSLSRIWLDETWREAPLKIKLTEKETSIRSTRLHAANPTSESGNHDKLTAIAYMIELGGTHKPWS
jgi:hypothetical protein